MRRHNYLQVGLYIYQFVFISEHMSMRVCMYMYILYIVFTYLISNFMYINILCYYFLYAAFFVNETTCPGGPRHKLFGVSR